MRVPISEYSGAAEPPDRCRLRTGALYQIILRHTVQVQEKWLHGSWKYTSRKKAYCHKAYTEYSGIIDKLLYRGVKNSAVCMEQLHRAGYIISLLQFFV